MQVDELLKKVQKLRSLLETGGARKSTLTGLDDFVALLDERSGQSIDEFIAELEVASTATGVNMSVVAKHLVALRAAKHNRSRFDIAWSALGKDKAAGLDEVDQIYKEYHSPDGWQRFYGKQRFHSSRRKALDGIRTLFTEARTHAQFSKIVEDAVPY